jgi:catechol 2,3-dioxygenase-like lactoylglutathione lyase family enzyme
VRSAVPAVDLKLELVPIPVADVDRAKSFYAERLGFDVDHDVQPASNVRVVQLTPPGSACSVVLTAGLPALDNEPGTIRGLHLVVEDIVAARTVLAARGVDLGEIEDLGGMLYAGFSDPDGNTWVLQEVPPTTPHPVSS